MPEACVQALTEEVHFVEGRKLAEDAMLWVSKGVVAAMTAIAPTVALILSLGKGNPQLDTRARPMLDALKVLVDTHTAYI